MSVSKGAGQGCGFAAGCIGLPVLIGIGVVVLGCAGIINFGGAVSEQNEKIRAANSSKATNKKPKEESKPEESRTLTMAKYKQLETGTSYAEAVKIIGWEGDEMSSNELAGIRTVVYSWKIWTGTNILLTFQDDKLTLKAQFGL